MLCFYILPIPLLYIVDEGKSLSAKERMEELAKNRWEEAPTDKPKKERKKKEKKSDKDKGYESGDSYNSGGFVERTQEDFDFIDAEDEDPDALRELYAEQHFHDERATGSDSEEEGRRKKKKSSGVVRKRGPDALSDVDDDDDCPVNAIVKKMKRKKKDKRKLSEVEEEAKVNLFIKSLIINWFNHQLTITNNRNFSTVWMVQPMRMKNRIRSVNLLQRNWQCCQVYWKLWLIKK